MSVKRLKTQILAAKVPAAGGVLSDVPLLLHIQYYNCCIARAYTIVQKH